MAAKSIPGPGAKFRRGRYGVIVCKSSLVRVPKARLDPLIGIDANFLQ